MILMHGNDSMAAHWGRSCTDRRGEQESCEWLAAAQHVQGQRTAMPHLLSVLCQSRCVPALSAWAGRGTELLRTRSAMGRDRVVVRIGLLTSQRRPKWTKSKTMRRLGRF
jgi:hypothetical protein